MLEEFKLPPPNRENIGDWLNVIDGWVGAAIAAIARLRDAALEQLLLVEGQVAKFARDNLQAGGRAARLRRAEAIRHAAAGQ